MKLHAWILPLASLVLASCGDSSPTPTLDVAQTNCTQNVANIRVSDGILERLCGCQEPQGVVFAPGSPLQCTVPSGTVVMFHYLAIRQTHQIISTGPQTFASSPVADPGRSEALIRSHSAILDTPGTYGFSDAYWGLTGTIIVQ